MSPRLADAADDAPAWHSLTRLEFAVDGEPEPQGSVKALPVCRFPRLFRTAAEFLKAVNLTSDNNALKSWRARIGFAATQAVRQHWRASVAAGRPTLAAGPMWPAGCPVFVRLVFTFPVPKSLAGAERRQREAANVLWPSVRPDVDKLARAALDALTGILWADDGQVVTLQLEKHYLERDPALDAGGGIGGVLVSADRLPLED